MSTVLPVTFPTHSPENIPLWILGATPDTHPTTYVPPEDEWPQYSHSPERQITPLLHDYHATQVAQYLSACEWARQDNQTGVKVYGERRGPGRPRVIPEIPGETQDERRKRIAREAAKRRRKLAFANEAPELAALREQYEATLAQIEELQLKASQQRQAYLMLRG